MSKPYAIFLGILYCIGTALVQLVSNFSIKKPSTYSLDDWAVIGVTIGGGMALTLFSFLTNPKKRQEILGGQSDTDFVRHNPNDPKRLPQIESGRSSEGDGAGH